jgi:hypothetical protein
MGHLERYQRKIIVNKAAWQRSPCQRGSKANCGKWGRIVNETVLGEKCISRKCCVQHIYHGRWGKRKGGLAGKAPSIFGKYIANLIFLKVYNKVKICL